MGRLATGAEESARNVREGSLAAIGATAWMPFSGRFNLALGPAAFTGTVQVERSFDGGATAHPCTQGGVVQLFTAPATEVLEEPEPGVLYRLNCITYTAGPIAWRLSQG
jgi:hypothetical protein